MTPRSAAPHKPNSYEVASGKTQFISYSLRASIINKCMPRSMYLPDLHSFEHIAVAHWPTVIVNDQWDWVTAVDTMELWLVEHIGSHYSEWAYHNGTSVDYWQACIAFRKPTYKTLFLLQWT